MGWTMVWAEINEQRRARTADKALRAAREKALQEREQVVSELPTNHDEALALANMKYRDSNLARCYLARDAELAALRANIEAMAVMNNDLHNENAALRERVAEARALLDRTTQFLRADVGIGSEYTLLSDIEDWLHPSAEVGT